jgi:hypothetical protein
MSNQYAIAELRRIQADIGRVLQNLEDEDAEGAHSNEFNAEPAEQFRQPERPQEYRPAPPPSAIRDPLAKSLSDLVTPKQLGMIRALARECKLDAEAECQAEFRCKTDELSKRAASSFIDHLKRTQEESAHPRRAS